MVMKSPDIAGCKITRESIRDAFAINVKDVAAVKGKTRRVNPSVTEYVSGRGPAEPNQELFSDVMFIRQLPVLVSVVHPIDLTLASVIKSQSAKDVGHAFDDQFSLLDSLRLPVTRVFVDGHPTLISLVGT